MSEYLHPSVSSKITDNSFVFQTATGNTVLFQCILAEKGEDNVLTLVTTPDEFIFKFGDPNVSKYGQASYNVLNWLAAGGVAYVIRVLPTTATFALTGLSVVAKAGIEAAPLTLAVREYAASNMASVGAINSFLTTEAATIGDEKVFPLGIVIPFGRGAGYNGLGVRISLEDALDTTYDFRTYSLEVTVKDALGVDTAIEGPFTVSFDPTARSKSRESVYWAYVVNKYSQYVKIVDRRSTFDNLVDLMNNHVVAAGEDLSPNSYDILFGMPRAADPEDAYDGWNWATPTTIAAAGLTLATAANLADLSKPLYLGGGTDGVWSGEDSEDALLAKGYAGAIDASVMDTQFFEFDVLLDANYPLAVKNAIAALAQTVRGDCVAMLDVGFQANAAQTLTYRQESLTVGNRLVSIWAHDMQTYDIYNGENIKVTTPYLLATRVPENDRYFGIQWPFVGPRRGVVSGVENINFLPNPVWKEMLYKAQINYIERDPRKTNFATQLTSQPQNSALSNVNNVRVILRIQREVKKMMADYRMEFNDANTLDAMNYDLNGYLQQWIANRACTSIKGTVYASEYDRQQKLARVKIELVFNGIIERVAIDIIVNR